MGLSTNKVYHRLVTNSSIGDESIFLVLRLRLDGGKSACILFVVRKWLLDKGRLILQLGHLQPVHLKVCLVYQTFVYQRRGGISHLWLYLHDLLDVHLTEVFVMQSLRGCYSCFRVTVEHFL